MEMGKSLKTSHGDFILRTYRQEDKKLVTELWESAFKQKLSPDVWDWKFHENYFSPKIILCLTDTGKPVAMYAGISYVGNWQGREITMGQIVDTMAHPEYRKKISGRKSLLLLTAEYFFEVYGGSHANDLMYGFPGKRILKLGGMFLNYQQVAEGGTYFKAAVSHLKRSFWPASGKVVQQKKNSNIFDEIWDNLEKYYPLAIKRNRAFFEWRFFAHPTNSYYIFTYSDVKGKSLASLVISFERELATIVDIISVDNFRVINKLINVATRNFLNSGIEFIQIWLPKKHFINKYLLQTGFKEEAEPLGITPVSKSFNSDIDFSIIDKNIFYTMADGDLF